MENLLEVAASKYLSYIEVDGTDITPLMQYHKLKGYDPEALQNMTDFTYICNPIFALEDSGERYTTGQDILDEIESLHETLEQIRCNIEGRVFMTLKHFKYEKSLGTITYILNPNFNAHDAWTDFSALYTDDPDNENYTVQEFVEATNANVPRLCMSQIFLDYSQPSI